MKKIKYDPEKYWDQVANEIRKRKTKNYLACDENPYMVYKRNKFLRKLFSQIDLNSKTVLEVGCGPGGNLGFIAEHCQTKKLLGADISSQMIELATKDLRTDDKFIKLYKINGYRLPLKNKSIDVSFTVTVLQHVTDSEILKKLIHEICRVTKLEVIIFEDVGLERQVKNNRSYICRPLPIYKELFENEGFKMLKAAFLNTKISRLWSDFVRFVLFHYELKGHHEGEPLSSLQKNLIGLPLFITERLDDLFTEKRDLARMVFRPD